MKHQDERQDFSPEKEAKRAKYMPDFDRLISNYENLLIRSRRESQEIARLRNEVVKRGRQLSVAEAQAAKDRTENLKLKNTLAALRQSKSVKAGRAVTLPARFVVKAIRQVSAKSNDAPASGAPSIAPVPLTAALPKPTSANTGELPKDPTALNEAYRIAAEEERTQESILRFVNHSYFVLGDISRPASMVKANYERLTKISVKDSRLIRIVLGLDELTRNEPTLPPKQPNAGYQVERNRVLYCAHSTGHYNSNGYSTRTAGVTHGLTSQNVDVVTMARPGYPWDVKVDVQKPPVARFTRIIDGIEHVYNPCLSWTDDRLDHYFLSATDSYVREAQRQRVALIHSASNYVTALPALIASRRLGIPFIYEVRGLWEITGASERPGWEESERYKFSERMETLVAQNADHVFAITAQIRDELIRRGVAAAKISLLPNSVDVSKFTSMPPYVPFREKHGLAEDLPVIGYAGSMVHYEGLSDLLKATRSIIDAGRKVRLVLVGDGPELKNLKAETKELQLSEYVVFTGRVPAEEIAKYISIFDIMPCPRLSLPVTELVSPLKPLEAMACANALVLTRVAPLVDLAGRNEERAVLVEPSNPDSLAAGILRLLDDTDFRMEIGRRARLWAVQERTWHLAGKLAVNAYEETLGSHTKEADGARNLREIRLAIVADTFTTEGLRPEIELLELRPSIWREQLEEFPVDALLVESAWEGIDNEWHQRVGFYSDEKFGVMQDILDYCRSLAIPTIFWNKEDPVHFNRFKNSARHFDHVFTTDSDCITEYAKVAGDRMQSISSLPFYAQPKIHNPLPAIRTYNHSVAYAGTFYGERYADRSRELVQLLNAVKPFGLTIYDRQLLDPNSPYNFPAELSPHVFGGLKYLEMVEAYKSHPVHINVNSVASSPTMFSRRVVELAASGSTIISGRGRGVDNVMAGLVHTVKSEGEAAILAERWMNDEEARGDDAWLAYRLIHRGHTAAHRLAYILRTAGLLVRAPELSGYALRIDDLDATAIERINDQTILPAIIIYETIDPSVELPREIVGICSEEATPEVLQGIGVAWVGPFWDNLVDRTTYEDLLTAERFGEWDEVSFTTDDLEVPGQTLAVFGPAQLSNPWLRKTAAGDSSRLRHASMQFRRRVSLSIDNSNENQGEVANPAVDHGPRTVIVAGHDLKFAQGIITELENQGHTVLIDLWKGHAHHDEARSRELLAKAEIVFCEWTLGNAVWYANNLAPHQRLVTRLHSQEVFTPYLKMLKNNAVDQIMVVGQHIADIAVRDHGIPKNSLLVIPNSVEIPKTTQPKNDLSRFTLGMVGVVPAQKHLDRAFDVLSALRKVDRRFTLAIKGKRPEDYPWMAQRPAEMSYYEEQYERLETDPNLVGAVTFDGFGNDMAEWYEKIGVVISVSDFESFHLTLADGAAHGALPTLLAWPGSDQIYPTTWISASVSEMVEKIVSSTADIKVYERLTAEARAFVEASFSSQVILPSITASVLNRPEIFRA